METKQNPSLISYFEKYAWYKLEPKPRLIVHVRVDGSRRH
jgi:hypothetical protein